MRFAKTATIAAILGLTVTPAQAGPKGGAATHVPVSKTSSPKTSATKAPKAPKVDHTTTTKVAKTAKVTGAPQSAKATKAPKAGKTATTPAASTTTSTTAPAATVVAPTTVDFTSGAVAEKLAKNSALRSKVESRLTAAGYTGSVYQAAYGFKNQGQFIAATNVSRNLGVPFEQLKLQMTGLSVSPTGTVLKANRAPDGTITMVDPSMVTNPAPTRSLGQAIQTVKADVNATAAADTATTQANTEIATTSTTASR